MVPAGPAVTHELSQEWAVREAAAVSAAEVEMVYAAAWALNKVGTMAETLVSRH